jgi:putative aldouronate transport system substrate-binding protein
MDPSSLSRRQVLRTCAGSLIALVGTSALAGACAPVVPRPTSPTATSPASLSMPVHVPVRGLPPADLAGSTDGLVPPAYSRFPATLLKSVNQQVGNGEDFTILTSTPNPPPPLPDQNQAWAMVNQQLGLNVKVPIVPSNAYEARLNTVVAGSDIPDLLEVAVAGYTVPKLASFLENVCADLTPYLGGDAIRAFPNLANFPSTAWPTSVFNGRIYTVPVVAGGVQGRVMNVQQKAFDEIGVARFTTIDDFTHALKQVTIPGQRYGIGGAQYGPGANGLPFFLEVFGAPNTWRESGGKLTKDWETDEFKTAVAYERSLWDAGVMHPDSPNLISSAAAAQFYAGKYVLWAALFQTYQLVWDRALASDPAFKPRAALPFSHDGKTPGLHMLGSGASGAVAIKKGPPERVKQALGVLNYLAAPFGTQENLLLNYGVEGVDFTLDAKGNPVLTQTGTQDLAVPWKYVVSGPDTLYDSQYADFGTVAHQEQQTIFGVGVQNPVLGLYSDTDAANGAALSQQIADGVNQIIFGRADISTVDRVVADWRKTGGDQIRQEYEQALQTSRK